MMGNKFLIIFSNGAIIKMIEMHQDIRYDSGRVGGVFLRRVSLSGKGKEGLVHPDDDRLAAVM
jgi:hypothetical protein